MRLLDSVEEVINYYGPTKKDIQEVLQLITGRNLKAISKWCVEQRSENDLEALTIRELRVKAQEIFLAGYSRMSKSELITHLVAIERSQNERGSNPRN